MTALAWRPRRRNVLGMVYTLHFTEPFGHARHYTGWTEDVPSRLAAHTAARGAHLVNLVQRAGIGFTVASVEPGTRKRERQLKKQGGASRRCRICREQRQQRKGVQTLPITTRRPKNDDS